MIPPITVALEPGVESDLKVFPNPAGDRLTIRFTGKAQGESLVRLLDLTGREIQRRDFTGNSADLSLEGVPAGMYLLECTQGEVKRVRRIVKE